MSQWWSWLLTVVGVTGLYFAGSRKRLGWAIGIAAQTLWIAYALATHQYGFLVSAVAYGWVYSRNFLRWRTKENMASTGEGSAAPGGRRMIDLDQLEGYLTGWRTNGLGRPLGIEVTRALVAEVRVALELRKAAGMVYDPSIDQAIWNDALIDALAAYDKVTGGK